MSDTTAPVDGTVSGDWTGPLPIVPVGLRVAGRPVLVVGGGRIAARKARIHLDQGAVVTMVAPRHGPESAALDPVVRHHRPFEPNDLDGAWLVVTATGDPSIDGAVFEEAERRRVWCNAADDPAHCSVILPAVSRRGPITVAVSSGGTSPATAAWLRRRIDALLDPTTLAVAEIAAQVRAAVRSTGRPTEVPGWAEVLDRDAVALVEAGRPEELERRLFERVAGAAETLGAGTTDGGTVPGAGVQ